jgi:hypothetical protein
MERGRNIHTMAVSQDSNLKFELNPDECYNYNPNALSILPLEGIGAISPTSRCIMDELRDWNRKIEKQSSMNTLHPSILYTIDKLAEGLNKYNNLTTQMKGEVAVNLALRQLTDFEKNGMNRYLYLYPFLVKGNNKVTARIALITTPKETKVEIDEYRQTCFGFSREMIDAILSTRSKKTKVLEESHQGNILFMNNNQGNEWFYPKSLSLEYEVVQLLKKGFSPYPYLPLSDFIKDFIDYGIAKKKVATIINDYHIIIDDLDLDEQGVYIKPPEVLVQLMIQADGLEKFLDRILIPQAKNFDYKEYLTAYEEFKKSYPAPPKSVYDITDVYIGALIKIAKSYPLTKHNTEIGIKIEDAILSSTQIIEGLLSERANIASRKEVSKYGTVKDNLIKKIEEWTRLNSTMLEVNFSDEFIKVGMRDEDEISENVERLKLDISKIYAMDETKNIDGQPIFYVVDQGYLALVIHKLTAESISDPVAKIELQSAKKIEHKLKKIQDQTLNAKIKQDHVTKLENDAYNTQMEIKESSDEESKKRMYNTPMGIVAFFTTTLIFTTVGYYLKVLSVLVFGLPIGLGIGVFVAIYFRDKEDNEGDSPSSSKESKSSVSSSGPESPRNNQVEQFKEIIRASESAVFGEKNPKSMMSKLISMEQFKQNIQNNLADIKSKSKALKDESDNKKVAQSIENALLKTSAVINVPDSSAAKGMPSTVVVSHSELKNDLFRKNLGEELRKEMENKKFDAQLVKYYSFLINTIEVNYYKYLPKKSK